MRILYIAYLSIFIIDAFKKNIYYPTLQEIYIIRPILLYTEYLS